MNMARRYTPGCKARSQVIYEARRPADEEAGIARHFQFLEHSNAKRP
jgi:hypothetical protein